MVVIIIPIEQTLRRGSQWEREIYEKLELLSGKELKQVENIIDSCLVLAGKER